MRNGKIAKLPESVRNELNPRMESGEAGDTILEWVNGLPTVQAMLKEKFDGVPISKQNLSEWRQGGFREWELKEDLFSATLGAREIGERIEVAALLRNLLTAVAARYAGIMITWNGQLNPEFEAKARLLGRLVRDFAMIQRMTLPQGTTETVTQAVAGKARGSDGGLRKQLQALLAGRRESESARATELVKEALAARPGGTKPGEGNAAEKVIALPGTMMGEALAKVVEMKVAGAVGSGLVKPGQTQSNQKVDYSAIEAWVHARRISP